MAYSTPFVKATIDHRAIAIHIPDASQEIPETIMAHGFTWIVVGIDDREVGHTRARLHIPDSIELISPNSFQDSSLECLTFGSAGALKTLAGFANCFIREITIPPFVELIKEGAFEGCYSLAMLDFSFCRRLREIAGFSGCTAIWEVTIPFCVRVVARQAFNNCTGLSDLAFENGSSVHRVGRFAGCDLTSLTIENASSIKNLGGFAACSIRNITVPSSVEVIEEEAFDDCRFLAAVDLSCCMHLREIHGFSGCFAISPVTVPACVHTIGRSAFNNCIRLSELRFEEGSCVHEVSGFTGSGLTSITFPRSLRIIASGALDDSLELSQVIFEDGSSIFRINGLRRTNLRLMRFPDSVSECPAFVQWPSGSPRAFIDYSGRCLTEMRRKMHIPQNGQVILTERYRHEIPDAFESIVRSDPSPVRTNESRFSNLRAVISDDPEFRPSLMLSIRVQIGHSPFPLRSRYWQTFTNMKGKNTTTIASVMTMPSLSTDFRCEPGRHCANGRQFIFTAYCGRCGTDSSITIRCPRDAMDVSVVTRDCCAHFFVASVAPADRRMQTLFLTSPTMRMVHGYGEFHPLRVMARILLRAGELPPEQLAFVQNVARSLKLTPHTIRTRPRVVSGFDDSFAELHGTFRLQIRSTNQMESSLLYDGREIVTLTWLAPWAIWALRQADYYELDCSFKALKPYVYSIPLAVKANVGIPLGIVIAPSERRAVYSIFADVLAEKGFSHNDLFEVPLLSDAGTALRSYAEGGTGRGGYHRHHYLCYRHLLESLGSDTLVALLARRLLFTRTENAFVEDHPQTVSDFVMGCEQDLICPPGREKFSKLFGVDLAQSRGHECARTAANVFREQALWGERGMTFGVAACSNHIEGMHGRLNARVQNLRNLRARFAETTSAIIASAAMWSEKVKRGWRATKRSFRTVHVSIT